MHIIIIIAAIAAAIITTMFDRITVALAMVGV